MLSACWKPGKPVTVDTTIYLGFVSQPRSLNASSRLYVQTGHSNCILTETDMGDLPHYESTLSPFLGVLLFKEPIEISLS